MEHLHREEAVAELGGDALAVVRARRSILDFAAAAGQARRNVRAIRHSILHSPERLRGPTGPHRRFLRRGGPTMKDASYPARERRLHHSDGQNSKDCEGDAALYPRLIRSGPNTEDASCLALEHRFLRSDGPTMWERARLPALDPQLLRSVGPNRWERARLPARDPQLLRNDEFANRLSEDSELIGGLI